MRIGFLGNTNNYPFRLARAFRALGHEVLFFVDRPRDEYRHRPECHYSDIRYPYPDWIQEIAPLTPVQIVLRPWALKGVLTMLDACDGVVLNGFGLSVGTRIRRPSIGLFTGSDLDVFANPKVVGSLIAAPSRFSWIAGSHLLRRILLLRFMRLQRAGIAKCCLVDYAIPGLLPESDRLLDEIGVDEQRRTSFMLTDIEHLPVVNARTNDTIRVFCATRLQWKRSEVGSNVSPLDLKGTDAMVEGLQLFVSRYGRPVQIRLITIGADVESVKYRIRELGLAPHVYWLPQLNQTEFLSEIAAADIVLENFNAEGCLGMAGRDAIAMGIPVVASGKSELFERELGESLPIFQATKPEEICARLNDIVSDPVATAKHSKRARLFAARWFSARRAAERCAEVLKEKQGGRQER